MRIFETFKCSGQNLWNSLCQFWNDKSIPLQILYLSSVSWKIAPLYCTFLALTIYTLLNRSPLKWEFLKLSSVQLKICEIPYASFETTIRFLSRFCISLQFHERYLLCTFLAQTIYTLLKRNPLKWKFLRLSSAQVKICEIPYAFKLILCQVWIKGSHQNPNFECSGKGCYISHVIFQTTSQLKVMLDKSVNNVLGERM